MALPRKQARQRRIATASKEVEASERRARAKRDLAERKQRFLVAFSSVGGVIAAACRATGIPRCDYAEWFAADLEFRAAVQSISLDQVDIVEAALFKAIKGGDVRAITFYLSHKGAPNGYTPRSAFSPAQQTQMPQTQDQTTDIDGDAEEASHLDDDADTQALLEALRVAEARGASILPTKSSP